MASTFAYVINFMKKLKIPNWIRTVALLIFAAQTMATDTNIKVIVVHIIDAILKLKFLKTLLKASLILLPNILIALMGLITSFRIVTN